MSRLVCWATINGVPIPVLTCLGGTVVIRTINQFPTHDLTFAAADARTIKALAQTPWALLELVQEGVGTIGFGYVTKPRQTIDAQGNDVIAVSLAQVTLELTWVRTGRGWIAQNYLSVIGTRLASLQTGWQSFLVGDPADDIVVQVTHNNPTVLAAYLDTARQFGMGVRLGANADGAIVDSNGALIRRLEMGHFGADPTVWIVSPNGASADDAGNNGLIRLPATVEYEPFDVDDLCTVTVPFGGGQSADAAVDAERLWRMQNDPQYPGYGRWGSDADSLARTGQTSLFTEYDPAYPISDPQNPPNGQFQFLFTDRDGTVVSGNYTASYGGRNPTDGSVPLVVQLNGVTVTNVFATLMQGPVGTRRITVDGRFDYVMYDRDAYALYGHKATKDFIDSSLNYTSSAPADQEYTARALYQECAAFFKRYAHPHTSFTATVNDAATLPPLAGDLIAVDYQKVSVGEDGAVVEMDLTENLKLMAAVRTFNGDDPAFDTLTLSNLGRFDATDATEQADVSQAIVASQRNEGTGLGSFYLPWAENIDSQNPIIIPFYITPNHYRYHQVRVQVDFHPFRGTANTAYSDPNIDINFNVPHDVAHDLQGTGVAADGSGITGTTDNTDLFLHVYGSQSGANQVYLDAIPGTAPDFVLHTSTGRSADLKISKRVGTTDPSHDHPFKAAVSKAVSVAANLIAKLPSHIHLIEQRIPTGQPSPVSILFSINGVFLSSGAAVSGTRNTAGAFTGSFVIQNIGETLDLYAPDTVVPLRLDAGVSPSNLAGVGYCRILIAGVEELGGESSTIRPA